MNLQGKTNDILLAIIDIIFLTLSANIWRYDGVVVNVLDFRLDSRKIGGSVDFEARYR